MFLGNIKFAPRSNATPASSPAPAPSTPPQFTELTHNSHYKVARLSSAPLLGSLVAHADIAASSQFVAALSDNGTACWSYVSQDAPCLLPNVEDYLPVLVAPSPGADRPGLVAIRASGEVSYLENVALTASVVAGPEQLSARMLLRAGETPALARALDPLGVVVATSLGRVFLVRLRDHTGKPHVTCVSVSQTRFLPFLTPKNPLAGLKPARRWGQHSRSVLTLSKSGVFSEYLISREGQLSCLFSNDIMSALQQEIRDLYDSDQLILEDVHQAGDSVLVLGSVPINDAETCHVLFTLKKDGEELLVARAYRLTRYTLPAQSPGLVVPEPGDTAYVVFPDAVVLVSLSWGARPWEDVITLKLGTILAATVEENGLVVAARDAGVLRITQTAKVATELLFAKTRIEQAIFSAPETPLAFGVPRGVVLEQTEIENAALAVARDILQASSAYLPPRMPLLSQHLRLREEKMKAFVTYCAENFGGFMSVEVKNYIANSVEKMSACRRLWDGVVEPSYNDSSAMELFRNSAKHALGDTANDLEGNSVVEALFFTGADHIGKFMAHILSQGIENKAYVDICARSVVCAIREGSLEIEGAVRDALGLQDGEFGSSEPWFLEHEICFSINTIFSQMLENEDKDAPMFVALVLVLFFCLRVGVSFYQSQGLSQTLKEQVQRYRSVYEGNRALWIKALIALGENDAAFHLAERFEDLSSLVLICDKEMERVRMEGLSDTFVHQKMVDCFERFGYPFAKYLYDYYMLTDKTRDLLLGFPEYKHYLKRYLLDERHGKVEWIMELLEGEYDNAGKVLVTLYEESDDLLENKKVELSVAKLSLMASNNRVLLEKAQNGLKILKNQQFLMEEVGKLRSGKQVDVASESTELVSKLTTKAKKRGVALLATELLKPMSKLLAGKTVGLADLIDMFTLLDAKSPEMKLNWYRAAYLLSLGGLNEGEQEICEKGLWRRAILADDWAGILKMQGTKLPEFIKQKVEGSVLYITLQACFKEGLFSRIRLPDLEELSRPISKESLEQRYKGVKRLEALEAELKKEEEAIKIEGFADYFKGVIGGAQGAGVVNYERMEVE